MAVPNLLRTDRVSVIEDPGLVPFDWTVMELDYWGREVSQPWYPGWDTRCRSWHKSLRCQGELDHAGAHWADVGRSPAVLRWGMVGYGCADPECIRAPGHDMPHRDGKGISWVPVDPDFFMWDPELGRII